METGKRVVFLFQLRNLCYSSDNSSHSRSCEMFHESHGHVGSCLTKLSSSTHEGTRNKHTGTNSGAGPHISINHPSRFGYPSDVLRSKFLYTTFIRNRNKLQNSNIRRTLTTLKKALFVVARLPLNIPRSARM